MAAQKDAKDPLTRALVETPVPHKTTPRDSIIEQATPRAQPVDNVLGALQANVKNAMPESFFDEGATTKTTPVRKRMRSEAGAVEVNAKRHDPVVQASVVIDVRCDQDEQSDAGRYQVRAEGRVLRQSEEGMLETSFPIAVEVGDGEGGVTIDSDQVRDDIAKAIRSTGVARST